MTTLSVGLTGGLASGKSTLGRWLAEAGFEVVDSDSIVATLYSPNGAGAQAVAGLFGKELLKPDGGVDHMALAQLVFADDHARSRLEAAVHPLVREYFRRVGAATDGIAVLEVPLLVESEMAADFDFVVTVEATAETRLRRAVERGLDENEARARIAAQTSESRRRAIADKVITNDGSLDEFRRQADELIVDLRQRASV